MPCGSDQPARHSTAGGVVSCVANGIRLIAARPLGASAFAGPSRSVLSGDATATAEIALAERTICSSCRFRRHPCRDRSLDRAPRMLTDDDRARGRTLAGRGALRRGPVAADHDQATAGGTPEIVPHGPAGRRRSTLARAFVADGYERLVDEAGVAPRACSRARPGDRFRTIAVRARQHLRLRSRRRARARRRAAFRRGIWLYEPRGRRSTPPPASHLTYGRLLEPEEMREAQDVAAFGPSVCSAITGRSSRQSSRRATSRSRSGTSHAPVPRRTTRARSPSGATGSSGAAAPASGHRRPLTTLTWFQVVARC